MSTAHSPKTDASTSGAAQAAGGAAPPDAPSTPGLIPPVMSSDQECVNFLIFFNRFLLQASLKLFLLRVL